MCLNTLSKTLFHIFYAAKVSYKIVPNTMKDDHQMMDHVLKILPLQVRNFCYGVLSLFNLTHVARIFGDPHIITLDLHKYTFNGKGEFILIETNDQFFMLQGRMEVVSNINGADAPGTVFTAVAAKQEDSDTIQFEIKNNATLICLVNGEMIDFNELKRQEFRNVSVFDAENNTFSASFKSGAYIKVQEMNEFIAVLIVSLPKQYKGLTHGLMGNYNGDISDDLIPKRSNKSLPLNSSLQTIHEQFGMTCEVIYH